METILFKIAEKQKRGEPTINQFKGRNGYFKCNGVELYYYKPSIRIYPITSKGETGNCFIEIPTEELGAFMEGLKRIDSAHQGDE